MAVPETPPPLMLPLKFCGFDWLAFIVPFKFLPSKVLVQGPLRLAKFQFN
jgi:hypothetical protein